jgi:hypothetical protein
VYHTGTNIGLIRTARALVPGGRSGGHSLQRRRSDGGELGQLPTSDNPPELERHTLVLATGVLHGKVYHWNSDSRDF